MTGFLRLAAIVSLLFAMAGAAAEPFKLTTRSRVETSKGSGQWQNVEKTAEWDPARTAVVICDMWDKHHCPDATERVGETAPRMNEVLKAARRLGMLIIHCPSDTMGFYWIIRSDCSSCPQGGNKGSLGAGAPSTV
jgi:hypothetical protein